MRKTQTREKVDKFGFWLSPSLTPSLGSTFLVLLLCAVAGLFLELLGEYLKPDKTYADAVLNTNDFFKEDFFLKEKRSETSQSFTRFLL
jgi:hypothetical protein